MRGFEGAQLYILDGIQNKAYQLRIAKDARWTLFTRPRRWETPKQDDSLGGG